MLPRTIKEIIQTVEIVTDIGLPHQDREAILTFPTLKKPNQPNERNTARISSNHRNNSKVRFSDNSKNNKRDRSSSSLRSDEDKCKHCGRNNHSSSECKACFNCGKIGHFRHECSARRQNLN